MATKNSSWRYPFVGLVLMLIGAGAFFANLYVRLSIIRVSALSLSLSSWARRVVYICVCVC